MVQCRIGNRSKQFNLIPFQWFGGSENTCELVVKKIPEKPIKPQKEVHACSHPDTCKHEVRAWQSAEHWQDR